MLEIFHSELKRDFAHTMLYCSMVDLILSEVRVQETLHHLSIAPSFFRDLLSVPVHSRSTTFAVDVRSDSVVVSGA